MLVATKGQPRSEAAHQRYLISPECCVVFAKYLKVLQKHLGSADHVSRVRKKQHEIRCAILIEANRWCWNSRARIGAGNVVHLDAEITEIEIWWIRRCDRDGGENIVLSHGRRVLYQRAKWEHC